MVNLLSKLAISGTVVVALLYQFLFKFLLFDLLGYGRQVASIRDYKHIQCERIQEPGLESCEDMWLHQKTGYLYMACSDSRSRQDWLPATGYLNATGRGLTDRIAVLDTRGPGPLASRLQWLSIDNFSGNNGDGRLNLHGFDVRADENTDILRIILINHRPPIDAATGELMDATKVGANSTIEQFQIQAGSSSMRHVRTYFDEVIQTPNKVVWVSDDSFIFSNDHTAKVGWRRELDPIIGGGNIGYCNRNSCHVAYAGLHGPNGLKRGRDGLIYVPNVTGRTLQVFSLTENHLLRNVHTIKDIWSMDNLSVDGKGDIYGAAFPKIYKWLESSKDYRVNPPTAVIKISRTGSRKDDTETLKDEDFLIEKMFEDDGGVLPGSTVAIHDSETGKFFLAGIMSPFIAICST